MPGFRVAAQELSHSASSAWWVKIYRRTFQSPFQIPRNAYQIVHSPPDAVPNTILGNSGDPRAVVDRDFLGPGAIGLNENGEEAM
jgi:hypothetical protein